MRRVVVTGVGAVTPVGLTAEESFENLVKGRSGVKRITYFDPSSFDVQIAAEVKGFEAGRFVSKKDLKKFDLFTLYAISATEEALKQSGLELDKEDPYRVGVSVGSGMGGLPTIEKYHAALLSRGQKGVSPFFIPTAIINGAGGNIAIRWGIKGPNYSNVTACATGNHSIGLAARSIAYGDCDVMITGGTESTITPLAIAGFSNMKALSRRNDEPEKASRPFDRNRDGFVVGEGAGILILEEYKHAKARGAEILAEFVGFGMTNDAYHIAAPDPEGSGAVFAMEMALSDGHIPKDEVDHINAHGTSTPLNDSVETAAIKKVFGEHAYDIVVSATKSMTGHALGAAGGIEAVFTVLSIVKSVVPPTINLDEPDDECDLFYAPHDPVERPIEVALSNAFGFGGANAVLAFKKFDV